MQRMERIQFEPSAGEGARTSTRILLVVEDDLIGRDLAEQLESLGYDVDDILTSGRVPLEETFRLESDVVVIDLQLRGRVEPIEAGRLIRSRWHRPIVYLVDDAQQAKRVAQSGAGAPHVMWPFAPGALDQAIRSVLPACSNVTSSGPR